MINTHVAKYIQDKGCKRILIAGVTILAAVTIVRTILALPKTSKDHDFANYYCSSRAYLEYENPYIVPLQACYEHYQFQLSFKHLELNRVTNPPLLLLTFAPIAMLPPSHAFAVWFLIELASLAILLYIIGQLLKDRISRTELFIICALSIGSAPVCNNFSVSQVQLPLAALALAGFAFLRSGNAILSCATITLTGLIKLYPSFLIPWFIWHNGKSNKARLKLTFVCILVAVTTFWISGFDTWIDFFRTTSGSFRPWIENRTGNHSLPSFIINATFAFFDFKPPPQLATFTWLFVICSSFTIQLIVYLRLWNNRNINTGELREKEFSLLCITMLATSLITWLSYYIFLVFPFVIAILKLKETFHTTRFLGMVLIWIGLNNFTSFMGNVMPEAFFFKVTINYVPLYSLIALGIFMWKDIKE